MTENLIPQSTKEVIQVLQNLPNETNIEKIAFAVAGVIYIASWKAGLLGKSSDSEKFSFFFKFTNVIDPNFSLKKTIVKLSGTFLNYVYGKTENKFDTEARTLLDLLIMQLSQVSENERTVMQGLMQVRNASYLYVLFSTKWSQDRFSDLDDAVKELQTVEFK